MPYSKRREEIYDLFGHALAQELLPRGHEIYKFGRTFLGHHYSESRGNFSFNTSILHILPQNYLPLGWRVMKLTSSCLLTLLTLPTKFNKDWPNSSWEEDVNGRRTTHDHGRQPIARGHLSDSADIKIHFHYTTCGHGLAQPIPWGSWKLKFWLSITWLSLQYFLFDVSIYMSSSIKKFLEVL